MCGAAMFGCRIRQWRDKILPKWSGRDAHALLDAVYYWSDLLNDRGIEAVEILRRVVIQQFYVDEDGIHWRTNIEGTPPSLIFINSPYDLDAHYGKKRSLQ